MVKYVYPDTLRKTLKVNLYDFLPEALKIMKSFVPYGRIIANDNLLDGL